MTDTPTLPLTDLQADRLAEIGHAAFAEAEAKTPPRHVKRQGWHRLPQADRLPFAAAARAAVEAPTDDEAPDAARMASARAIGLSRHRPPLTWRGLALRARRGWTAFAEAVRLAHRGDGSDR